MKTDIPIAVNGKKEAGDGYRTIAVRLEGKNITQLDMLAIQTNHSRNELIDSLLEQALEYVSIE